MDELTVSLVAIDRLQRAYADCATRRAWDEMVQLAAPGAVISFHRHSGEVVEVDPSTFIGFAKEATASFSFYEFVALNGVVSSVEGDRATGRFYNLEVSIDGATGDWIDFYGKYEDEYVRVDGDWKFARRDYRTLVRKVNGRPELPGGS